MPRRTYGERLLDRVSPIYGREEQLDALERVLEDANNVDRPKQIVLLSGPSGLSKCQLAELAFGVYNQQRGHRRVSSDNPKGNPVGETDGRDRVSSQSNDAANVTYNNIHHRTKRRAPCSCWYGFGKFTKQQEGMPFAELSRSIAEIVTQQVVPELHRVSAAKDHEFTLSGTVGGGGGLSATTTSNKSSSVDTWTLLRDRLTVSDVNVLTRFCPEVEQLHLYTARERALEKTKRAAAVAKESAMAVTEVVGRGLAVVAPSIYFTKQPPLLSASMQSDGTPVEINGPGITNTTNTQQCAPPFTNKMERLKYVVKLFFRALSETRPVIWILDDLQYATKDGLSSLSFIQSILDDSDLKRFVFCGVVRDDDTTEKERRTVQKWAEGLPSVLELSMKPMQEHNVRAMMFDLLHLDDEDLTELASLIYQRTHGNDYFVFEMINYLQQEGVIFFSTMTYKWKFDIDEAKRKTMVSENVLSFVGRRLQQLPGPVQQCLKFAAFLGYRFDEDLLSRVVRSDFAQSLRGMKENSLEIHDLLQMAVKEGFIEMLSYPNVVRYKFVHVEIQMECERLFQGRLGGMTADQLHWNIGAALWRGWRKLESYQNIENRILFPCVKELNAGTGCYQMRKETRDQLAKLNREAAKRSYELHAFFPAASYLETAAVLIGRDAWKDNYDLSLELHTFLAQMYLASGQLDKIPNVVRIVGERAISFQDRLPVDLVELARCQMLGEIDLHIQKSISLLNILGVSLSGDYFWFQVERKKRRVKAALQSWSNEEIQAKSVAPRLIDGEVIELIEQNLINTLSPFSSENRAHLNKEYPNLEAAVACKMVEAFIKGQSGPESSATCLALAACLFCEHDSDKAYLRRLLKWLTCSKDQADLEFSIRLAEMALKVPNSGKDVKTIGVVGLVRHWRYPLPNCAEIMLKGYNLGMESGDLRFAARAATGYIQMYFFSGLPLSFLAKDVNNILTVMVDYSQKYDAMRIFTTYQLILNLTGQSGNVLDLSYGDAIDRATSFGCFPLGEPDPGATLMLYVHCQEFGLATALFEKLEASSTGIVRFHATWHIQVYFLALVAIHNAKKTVVRGRKWKRKARKYVGLVRCWVEDCQAINLGHKLKLLEAEVLTLQRPRPTDYELMAAYDEAIVRSARSGFLQDAATAAALASKAIQPKSEKHRYARRSQEFYASWGAYGVIRHLRKRSRMFRESCDENIATFSNSGEGVQGRQRFLDEEGILQIHRSITAAEDKVQKEAQLPSREQS